MLRARMGDAAFLKMLAALRESFGQRQISTEEFRIHCSRFAGQGQDKSLEAFFDQWIYGTGIPQLKLTWTAKPGRVTGTIKQVDVRDDFSVAAPIEIRVGTRTIRKVVPTESGETTFSFPVTGVVSKVTLDSDNSILKRP
jgi:aminopeptidase N